MSQVERQRRREAEEEASRQAAEANREKQRRQRREESIRQKVAAYWEGLSPTEQDELDATALRDGDPDSVAAYRQQEAKGFKFASTTFRVGIRDPYIRRLLGLDEARGS